jgi:hypothetical protein
MMAIYKDCGETLEKLREVMKTYADRDRTEVRKYSNGELVMWSGTNIHRQRPCKQLNDNLHVCFEITEVMMDMAVHQIFSTQ